MPQNDSTSQIEIGDWVKLRSGSPALYVYAVYDGRACVVRDDAVEWFPLDCLVHTAFDKDDDPYSLPGIHDA